MSATKGLRNILLSLVYVYLVSFFLTGMQARAALLLTLGAAGLICCLGLAFYLLDPTVFTTGDWKWIPMALLIMCAFGVRLISERILKALRIVGRWMSAERSGIILTSTVGLSLVLLVRSGFQPRASVFLVVGMLGLLCSCACFLLLFRSILMRNGGRRWLQAAMVLLSVQLSFLAAEGALRIFESLQRRSLSEREAFIVNEYLPPWRSEEFGAGLHKPAGRSGRTLIPKATVQFLDSVIRINSHGTRGPEFAVQKQPDELRVLCLGASTTWGATVKSVDRPYPEVLEEMLRSEFDRPVTVINSGIAGLQVQATAHRLEVELMRFQSDVAVVYHGFNNIRSGISSDFRFHPRGSLLVQQALSVNARWPSKSDGNGFQTVGFRKGLERIVTLCAANDIKLFLCTFALAYDENTPQRLLEFYSRIMPLYGDQHALHALRAIRAHNQVVEDVAGKNDVEVIDIASLLGGRYEHFIDFCHFHQSGRDIFAGEVARAIRSWEEQGEEID